ncbi:OmpL47-type beta-barrel domain-containing protein [Neobacillus cucumis]|uniref:Ig-like domain-containing protein n=1 Tax=Neobacillus cucumis TaxID=1740721 RepID=A0A2N5HSA8_9BACI|nr:Ig-like domain repeat protein [Neobacillus cucumis]PLS08402.1 hypothetical protein CVD27_03055 [Neobacillus cucumis]
MRKKLSFLSGLAAVILFLFSTAINTFAANGLADTNTNCGGSVSGNVYGYDSGVTSNVYGNEGPGVTGDVYGSIGSGITGDVYGYNGSGVTGDVYGNEGPGVTGDVYGNEGPGVTGDVYGNQCTGVTGDVYGNEGSGVTGDVYGNQCTGVTGDVYGNEDPGVTSDVYGNQCTGVTPFIPPLIDSVSVTPQTVVTVNDQVTVRIKAHDDPSGISMMTANFNNTSGTFNGKSVWLRYDPSSGDWVGTFNVGQNDMTGKWTLSVVSITDNAGNYTDVTVAATADASFTVDNPNADYTAPIINSTKLSASSIHVGEKVTITSDVTDDKSGVDTVNASLSNQQGGDSYNIQMRYDAAIMKWVGTFEATETTKPGQWDVYVDANDKAYNYTSDYSIVSSFTVVNQTGDYIPPVISNVVADKTEVNAGDQITFTATVDDSQSGVGWVEGTLNNVGTIVFKKDNNTGKWVGTATIPTNITDGTTLALESIHATDLKGNASWGGNSVFFLVHNKTGDYTAPSLDDLQISSVDVTAGDQITIKAKVSDSQTGVKSVSGFFNNSNSDLFPMTFTYDASSGFWIANCTIPSNVNPGQLELKVDVEDNNQNSNLVNTGKYIKVSNPNIDITAPVIENVEMTPSILNVGDKLNVAATITDTESGVRYVVATIHSGSHFAQIPLTFDAALNKWVGSYTVQANDPSGTWEFNLGASDSFYNIVSYSNVFKVNNPDGDLDAPYLDSFTESSSTANVGDTVHFETMLKDDQSGVKSAHLEIYTDDYRTFVSVPLSFDKTKGVWTADYIVPSYSTAGPHNIIMIANDNAGNEMWVQIAQRLLIFNDHPDNDVPIVSDITANLNKVSVGDTLDFKVKLSDSGSGVGSAYVVPSMIGSTTAYDEGSNPMSVPLEYDKDQNLWVGKYTVKSSDLQGTYIFGVYATDNAGNSTMDWNVGSFTIIKQAAIDKTSPVTTTNSVNQNWTHSDATITLTATDDLSGLARTEYRVNNVDWQVYTGPITINQEGQNTVDYRSIDNAGNTEEMKSLSVKIDKTEPVTALSTNTGTPNGKNGWYTTDVQVNLSATDSGGSGIAKTEYRINGGAWTVFNGAFTLSTDGTYTIDYRSTDNAGNTEQSNTQTIKLDKTAPTFTISLDKNTLLPANQKMVSVTGTINAYDDTSGIDSVVLTSITSNEPLQSDDIQNANYNTPTTGSTDSFELRADRLGNGNGRIYTIVYTATDKAGNVSTKSVTVSVPHDQSNK